MRKLQLLKQWCNKQPVTLIALSMDDDHIMPYRQLARAGHVDLDVERVTNGFVVRATLTDSAQSMLARYRARNGVVRVVERLPVSHLSIAWRGDRPASRLYPVLSADATTYTVDIGGNMKLQMNQLDRRIIQVHTSSHRKVTAA